MLRCFCFVLGLAIGCAALAQATRPSYRFTLNGKEIEPEMMAVYGTASAPEPGDVAWIDGFPVVLDERRELAFRTEEGRPGVLLLRGADGRDAPVAVGVEGIYDDNGRRTNNPLQNLSDAQIRALRGAVIREKAQGLEAALARLDPDRAMVVLQSEAATLGAERLLEALPATLRYLEIRNYGGYGPMGLGGLARLNSLRSLRCCVNKQEDWDRICDKSKLRWLEIEGKIADEAALARLADMRTLKAHFLEGFDSISFVRQMPALRELDISYTIVEDLSPLEGHRSIEGIDANSTRVKTLPGGLMPALRELRNMSTAVADEEVRQFAARNPRCVVWHRWTAVLRRAVEGATRIRVRSGGTCHRDPESEETLFESRKPQEVRAAIGLIEIDDADSGFECMCCGSPTIEFYKGDELLAACGVHHGRSLRWQEGWPGDALLTRRSGDGLVKWLADRGVNEPAAEREEEKRREAAARRRAEAYAQVMPAALRQALEGASGGDAVAEAFATHVKDPGERALLCLRLLGCHNGAFNESDSFTSIIVDRLLPGIETERVEAAIIAHLDDARAIRGAARWLLEDGRWKELKPDAVKKLLPQVAAAGLAHPKADTRRLIMQRLAAVGGAEATAALRLALAGGIVPATMPAEDQDEPGGMVSISGDDDSKPKLDSTVAAKYLAQLGDRESLEQIRKLAASAPEPDAEALKEAVEKLEKEGD